MSGDPHETPPAERVRQFVERYHPRADEFVLYAHDDQQGRTPCDRWARKEHDWLDIYEGAERRALAHVNTVGGVVLFSLEAQHEGRSLAHELMRVSAEALPGAQLATEPANEGGMLAMLMRHQEATQRMALGNTEKLLRASIRIVESATKRASDAEKRAMEQFDVLATQRTADLRAQAELENQQANAALKRQVGTQLAALLPQAAGKILGKTVGPEVGAVVALKGFLETIRPEQMDALLRTLDPAQQAALLDLYRSMQPPEEQSDQAGEGVH